jgi:hypothetical protein
MMRPGPAKKLIEAELIRRGLTYTKLTAVTIHFDGDPKLFVIVHDWTPDPQAEDLRMIGHDHDFIVSFRGNFIGG